MIIWTACANSGTRNDRRSKTRHRTQKFDKEVTVKAQEFEELNVYQRARELTNRTYELTRDSAFARDFGLIDQIRRASVSIMSNIAEGFERGTNAEFVQFLYIAKGSAGEVRAQVSIAFDQKYISREDYDDLTDRCRRVSGILNNLIAYLRQPRFAGRRTQKPQYKSLAEELNEILKKG